MLIHRPPRVTTAQIITAIRQKLIGPTVQLRGGNYHIIMLDDVLGSVGVRQVKRELVLKALRKTELIFLTGNVAEIIYIRA